MDPAEIDQRAVELGDGLDSEQAHRALHVGAEPLEHAIDAPLATDRQTVEIGATRHRRRGPGGNRLQDVATAADTAVAHDLDATTDGVSDRRDERERCWRTVELAAAVIR